MPFDDSAPGPATGELPIAEYNHLPRREVEGRLPDLDREQVELVLRYERRHRARTPVLRLLTTRLREFRDRRDCEQPAGGYGPAPRRTES
ncbi:MULTISPECIES: hypothetical protein [unclassified Streptomyces]|uniref:hypothetical protein n=1 Tax=unclassified Streptomyces TaxID=2593676 RepID=UPI00114CFCD1|nr:MULTISPECIES: hypothetical protein [unclassified Streptomyces]MYS19341.1 hypothetical protein [Streptomyces sp. SID4948]